VKESSAWRSIAKNVDSQTGMREGYLCNVIQNHPRLSSELKSRMQTRIAEALGVELGSVSWHAAYPLTWNDAEAAENRAARVLAALTFAQQAKDEEATA